MTAEVKTAETAETAAAAEKPAADPHHLSTAPRAAVPTVLQMSEVECGAACLGMVLAHFGRWVPLQELRAACGISRDGATALDIVRAGRTYGIEGKGHLHGIADLEGLPMPAIIWLRKSHFAVLEGVKDGRYHVNDPASGRCRWDADEFERNYSNAAVTFEKTDAFVPGGHKFRVTASLTRRLRHSRAGVTFVVLAGLLSMVLGLAVAPISEVFVNRVLLAGQDGTVTVLVTALLAIGLFRLGLTLLQYGTLTRLQTKFSLVGSTSFVGHLLRLPVEFYMERSAGDLSQRVTYNSQVAQLLATEFATAGVSLVGLVGYAALLLHYQWQLALIVLGLSALNVVALQAVFQRRKTGQSRVVHAQNELRGTTVSAIKSIETLKATGMEDQVFGSLTGQQAHYLTAQSSLVTSTALLGAIPTVLFALSSAAVLVVGGWFVMDGSLNLGALLAVQALAASTNAPVQTLMGLGTQLQVITASVESLDDVLANPIDDRFDDRTVAPSNGSADDVPSPAFKGGISLRNVTFGYSRTHPPVITDLSLDLEPGARLALVGVTGAGKTTIGNLAAGLLEPWSGEVLFDGRPLSAYGTRELAGARAKVDQTIVLFEGTVRDNVTMWDRSIRSDEVVAALRDAQLLDDVLARPSGLETRVEEDGRNFSGGQCQRMEIARALALEPRALILDEATSALDASVEKAVDDALRARGVSCLIIAHRLSTIRDADEIIVLGRGGKVVERGTHVDLMAAEGEYFRLVHDAGEGGDVGT